MLSLEYEARNAGHVAMRLRTAAYRVDDETRRTVGHFGAVLVNRVRARAPRDTGRYASRIHWRRLVDGIVVSSPDVFARRLELGFIGVDSAGRNVVQDPRPHFRPALRETEDEVVRALANDIERLV